MSNFILTNKRKKEIAKISKQLPKTENYHPSTKVCNGSDINNGLVKHLVLEKDKKGNFVKDEKGNYKLKEQVLKPSMKDGVLNEKKYVVNTYSKRYVNHKKEMIKIAENKGWDGVLEYLKPYMNKEAKSMLDKKNK